MRRKAVCKRHLTQKKKKTTSTPTSWLEGGCKYHYQSEIYQPSFWICSKVWVFFVGLFCYIDRPHALVLCPKFSHVRFCWMHSSRPELSSWLWYIYVSLARSAGERIRQSFCGRGYAAWRNRPGSSRYYIRRSTEDDQSQFLFCSALSQNANGFPTESQTRGKQLLYDTRLRLKY